MSLVDEVKDDAADTGAADTSSTATTEAAKTAAAGPVLTAAEQAAAAAVAAAAAAKTTTTIAAGAEAAKATAPTWPENWRDLMANGDAKERKRLDRITDPRAVWGNYREMEAKFSQGGLIKVPGPKATDEEKTAYRKATGVPDEPKAYFEKLTLPEGKVLGEADKPVAEDFAKVAHTAGFSADQFAQTINWYQDFQEKQASDQYNADQGFRATARTALEADWGPAMSRNIGAITTIFATAPGGTNLDDDKSLMSRLLGGRTADGHLIGDDPEITRWLSGLALEVNPLATVVPATADQMKSVTEELGNLRKLAGKQDSEYWVGPKSKQLQARFAELLDAEGKAKARTAA